MALPTVAPTRSEGGYEVVYCARRRQLVEITIETLITHPFTISTSVFLMNAIVCFLILKNPEIRKPVVRFTSVFMMNDLAGLQISSQLLFSNVAVKWFIIIFKTNISSRVFIRLCRFITPIAE